MKQNKIDSVLEALTNILIGAGIALCAQLVWFPFLGKSFTMVENLATTAFFTLISFLRTYGIRRLFNGKSIYFTIVTTVRRTYWCWKFNRLDFGDQKLFKAMEIDPESQIKRGDL